jgi:phosphotriesterase-related protein
MRPKSVSGKKLAKTRVTLNSRGEVFRDANVCADNMILDSVHNAVAELLEYKRAGGQSVVDVTPKALGRDHRSIVAISKASRLNVICATGWHVDLTLPSSVRKATVESLSEVMHRELTEGIEGTEIRAGLMKIGCSYPWTKDERKVLEAAVLTQTMTGAPIGIHTAQHDPENRRYAKQAGEYLSSLQKKGANFDRVYLSHMDFTADDPDYHRSLIEKYGMVLGYDDFGHEQYYDTFYPGCGGISDNMRVKGLVELLKSGYEKHIILSHDLCLKINYKKYGGFGYSHVLRHIIPELRDRGVTRKQVRTMLVENPRRILSWA